MTQQQIGVEDFRSLAAFAAELELTRLPDPVVWQAKSCLLYGLAVGVATLRVWQARAVCSSLEADEGGCAGTATRLLDGKPAGPGHAAMANAVLLSGRVQGDSHPAGHLGGVIIPVALAMAERNRLSGAAFLSALIAGYEVALRIGRDHAAALTACGFRTTPCYGVFGAAAAAARALGFDASGTLNALSLSSNLAAGLREYVNAGTEESPFQAGFAARNGLTAALLVAAGLPVAAPTALHGAAGFYAAYGGLDGNPGARLCDGLGQQFEMQTVTYKPYPACQFLRGMIRSLIALRNKVGAAAVAEIDIRLHPFEANFVGVRFQGPFVSSAQTVMSGPFCAALAWATGSVGYAGLRRFDDTAVLAVVPRVNVIADPTCTRYQTRLRVTLQSGEEMSLVDTASDQDFRLTWPLAERAAHTLCAEVGTTADELINAIGDVETAADISAVVRAATKTIAGAAR